MTEAMPFLQKYDITFLRPPAIRSGSFVYLCLWRARLPVHGLALFAVICQCSVDSSHKFTNSLQFTLLTFPTEVVQY